MKNRQQIETKLLIREESDKARQESDNRYAIKLVERIVFTLLALAFLGAVGMVVRIALTGHL